MASIVVVSCQADSGMIGISLAAGLQPNFGNVGALEHYSDPRQHYPLLFNADVALIVIGPNWATLPPGSPGIDAMRAAVDFLLRGNRPRLIVPVLVNGATMPPANALAPGLQPLTYLQVVTLDGEPTAANLDQLRARIREYRRDVSKAAHAKGNYLWFKIASFAPLAIILLDGGVRFLNSTYHLVPLGAFTEAVSLISLLLYAFAFLGLWVTSIVVASQVRRYVWLVANILSVPAPAIPGIVYVIAPRNATLTAWCVTLALIFLANAMMFQPIWFGLALPPFRKKRDGV